MRKGGPTENAHDNDESDPGGVLLHVLGDESGGFTKGVGSFGKDGVEHSSFFVDFLLKERVHDDGTETGILDAAEIGDLTGEGRG